MVPGDWPVDALAYRCDALLTMERRLFSRTLVQWVVHEKSLSESSRLGRPCFDCAEGSTGVLMKDGRAGRAGRPWSRGYGIVKRGGAVGGASSTRETCCRDCPLGRRTGRVPPCATSSTSVHTSVMSSMSPAGKVMKVATSTCCRHPSLSLVT